VIRPSTLLLLASVALSAACAIIAAHRHDRAGVYVFKPATTLIILVGATWLIVPAAPLYRALVVAGLACSLAGDVALMLPHDRLLAGLAAFLLAHVAYLVAFSCGNPVTLRQLVWLLPFLAFGTAVVANRWSALWSLKVAVLVYAVVICTVGWRAAMRGQAVFIPRPSFLFALFGACLFLVSDAIVLLRRFGRPFPAAQSLELSTYWAAQVLIALSVRGTSA
jgi:uncharacterized membrane protein YhhN